MKNVQQDNPLEFHAVIVPLPTGILKNLKRG